MGMLSRLFRQPVSSWFSRGYQAADTDRLNQQHWRDVSETSINRDIVDDRETVAYRCRHERQNNPFVDGVINTHITDVVGADGPTLQIESDSDRFNNIIEAAWQEWWELPDAKGRKPGVEFLNGWVGMLWTWGEFIYQDYMDELATTDIAYRINGIHPSRLKSPLGAYSPMIIDGVELDRIGRVIRYHIADYLHEIDFTPLSHETTPVDAADLVHVFREIEEDQQRGMPLLAPALPTIERLADYEKEVLQLTRLAARMGVLLYTDHDDAQYINPGSTETEMHAGTIRTAPPGWKPHTINPGQPNTQYIEFTREHKRAIGRSVGMPLMKVLSDSSQHNYSSARFDGQNYNRANKCLQSMLTRRCLVRSLRMVMRELQFARRISINRRFNTKFTWPVAPHVDPQKEANGIIALLEAGVIDEYEAASMLGQDYDTVCALRRRAKDCRERHGLSEPGQVEPNEVEDEDTEQQDEERNGYTITTSW